MTVLTRIHKVLTWNMLRLNTRPIYQLEGFCALLVADLFLFCYERDFKMSLSDHKQANVIDAFNTTSRYLDDILIINNVYFDNMVNQIYQIILPCFCIVLFPD